MPFRLFAAKRRQMKWCHAKREHPYHLSMVNIRSNVHKKLHFVTEIWSGFHLSICNEQMGTATSEESRVIVLFLCTSSDHVLYFEIWPWRSLTDLVIAINSAYHLSIRKLQKSFHWWRRYRADTRSNMTDGYMMDRQTGRQTDRQTDERTT